VAALVRSVDLAHAAHAQRRSDFIGDEARPKM
jgi:hypothetical protein